MRAVRAPEIGAPPAAATPTNANWEAPVNITKESAQVCTTESPAATATAPNETPYRPVARPTPRPSRMIARRGGGRTGGGASTGRPQWRGRAGERAEHGPTLVAGRVSGGG